MDDVFLGFINSYNVENFEGFCDCMNRLDSMTKGIYFEYFCKLFFTTDLMYSKYKNFMLYKDIPDELKNILGIPMTDKGIDAIVYDENENVYAIQCKYRSDKTQTIPFGQLATFPGLTFGTDAKFDKGIFFSNCIETCYELKNAKYINIMYDVLERSCGIEFWENVKNKRTIHKSLTPLKHQIQIIDACKRYYETEDKGRLYLACGCGKTFIGYWLSVIEMRCNKILVVVPSLYLVEQTYNTYFRETTINKNNYKYLLIASDGHEDATTNEETITTTIEQNDKIIVITTYQSSELLLNLKNAFDFTIYDEAHRTVGEKGKCFTSLLCAGVERKKMFMTATEKIYNYGVSENILSMDDVGVYGDVIYKYSMREAIDDDVLVDYKIVAPFMEMKDFEDMRFVDNDNNEYDVETIMMGMMILRSMEHCGFRHLLIFSNRNERAAALANFINAYNTDLYCRFLSGDDSMKKRKKVVAKFEEAERAIISSAKIFGEGVDIKMCDAVCFADSKSSAVDIVQYVGRCLRKCKNKPNKISHVLVPFMVNGECNFFDYESRAYIKLRRILKMIGTTDNMVTENFRVIKCEKMQINNNRQDFEETDDIVVVDEREKVDIKNFKLEILAKVFDRNGDKIDRLRNTLIAENKRRYRNDEELIDTRKKCIAFLGEEPQNVKNWIRYALGDRLYNQIKTQYYENINEFVEACNKLKIENFNGYKINSHKDAKLPYHDYINDGFYYDLDNKFNINALLSKKKYRKF